jgi:hypothetical protein
MHDPASVQKSLAQKSFAAGGGRRAPRRKPESALESGQGENAPWRI